MTDNTEIFVEKRGTCEQWIKEGKGAIKWTQFFGVKRSSLRSEIINDMILPIEELNAAIHSLGRGI